MVPNLTGIIPTYNEEDHIEAAIDSLSFADEVLVIDSFSTDKTVSLAKAKGARIVQREFDDFSSQKNYAINLASYNWVFLLDADERISLNLKEEIIREISKSETQGAYWVPRSNVFMGKRIKYSGWQNDKVIRLFKKSECRYNGKLAHEEIHTDAKVGTLQNVLDHYTYRGLSNFVRKNLNYVQLQAQELSHKGKKAHIILIILKPIFRFFKHYILQKGFLDGAQGLFISVFYAFNVFLKYLNLWLINKGLK